MKKSFKILSAAILTATMAFGLGATIFSTTAQPVEQVHADVGSYYSDISDSLTGNSLLTALNSLNSQKRTSLVGYNGMKTFSATCDADPDGSGKIIGFYDNKLIGPSWDSAATWNREHVWPNARGGSSVEGDAHMVRPASVSTNSGRGSKGFGEDSFDPGSSVAYYRGVASRIIFYCAIANTNLKIEDIVLNSDGSSPANTMGTLSDMLKWNLQYLPTDTSFTGANDLARRTEIQRNERIQTASGGQGNRNPFIDHPEYACKIWGNTNDKTKAICGGSVTPADGVSISKTEATIAKDGSTTISATSTDSSTITWSSNKTNVVTVSNATAASGASITLTGISAGTATITAKATINSVQYTGTCSVTVTSSGSQQSGDYSIVFNTGSDGSSEIDSNGALNYTSTNTLVESFSSITKCYQGASGLKLGSSKATGSFTATTKTAAKTNVKSVTVTSTKYGSDTGTLSLSLNGTSVKTGITPGEDYTYTYTNPTTVNNFSISTSTKRAYVGSVSFTIQGTTKTLSSIAVKTAPAKTTYTAGEYFDPTGLVITATYTDNSHEDISYASSSNSFSFTPNTTTALTVSNTSVTINYGGKSCSQAITVNAAATPTVNSVTVSPSTLSLAINGTSTLTATVSVSGGAAQTVNWSSNNTSVATVNSSGKVTAVAAGTATITATSTVDSNKKGTCTVTVTSGGSGTQPQHAGTEADPYTTADAKLVMDNTGSGVVYQTEVYVSMVPTSSSFNSSYNQYTCTDSNMEISSASLAFTPKGTYTEANALVGKTVVAKGYIELYQGVYKMGYLPASVSPTGSKYNPSIISITPDSSGEQSEGVYTLAPAAGSNTSYAGSGDVTIDNVSWAVNGNNSMIPWRLGGKSITNTDRTVTSTVAVSSENISSVVLTVGNASDITVNSLTLKVGTSQGANDVNSITATFEANSDITFERPSGKDWSNCYFTFVFNVTVSINSNKFVQFTKAVFYANNSTSGAATYAATFLSAFTCNAQGTSAPTFTTSWAQLKTAFNALDTADQNTLRNATANENGTDIEKAMARYDYVVAKYGYENFISRASGNSANKMNAFNGASANNLLLVLGSISLLGGLTYLAYFLKKRKED